MHSTSLSSRELLDVLSLQHRDDGAQRVLDMESTAKTGQYLTAFWRRDSPSWGNAVPNLITLPKDEQRDFLAWAYTYLPSLRPLTAFIRLLDPTTASKLLEQDSDPNMGNYGEAFIALIICEAMTLLVSRSETLQQLTPNACANSHSYALARTVALGSNDLIEEVSLAWSRVRALTRQRHWEHNLEDLRLAFRVLMGCRGELLGKDSSPSLLERLLERACREIAEKDDINEGTWSELTGQMGHLSAARPRVADSRENRIRTFEHGWATIAGLSQRNPTLASFICGYLGSRIAPGELDHAGVVARTLDSAPAALLWFGVCSGLRSDGQVLAFSKGLGQRVLRDLEQSSQVLDRPKCDLAITELQVLFDREAPLSDFRTGGAGSLMVELIPGVTTSVRWPVEINLSGDLFDRRDPLPEARGLMKELSMALERVEYLQRRLERIIDPEKASASRNRSEPKRKKEY